MKGSQDPKWRVDQSQEKEWLDQFQAEEKVDRPEKQEGVFTLPELLLARPGTHQSAAARLLEKTTMVRRHNNLQKTVTMQLPIQLGFSCSHGHTVPRLQVQRSDQFLEH